MSSKSYAFCSLLIWVWRTQPYQLPLDFIIVILNQKAALLLPVITIWPADQHAGLSYQPGDWLVFGSEISGLSPQVLQMFKLFVLKSSRLIVCNHRIDGLIKSFICWCPWYLSASCSYTQNPRITHACTCVAWILDHSHELLVGFMDLRLCLFPWSAPQEKCVVHLFPPMACRSTQISRKEAELLSRSPFKIRTSGQWF